ncbi:acyl-coenzyme A synthetase/AMP-(fatty) acid ligase [Streptomyces ambofaciens]
MVLEDPAAAGELPDFLAGLLDPHQLPVLIEARDALPRGITGKVLKRVLRQELADQ